MKKSFFIGALISLLAVVVLALGVYAAYMTGGTRLLYENSVWGARWRSYPWILLAGAVLLIPGIICLKVGYVPKAKRTKRARPAAKMPKPAAVPPTAAPVGKTCPVCGKVNRAGVGFCVQCGSKLDT
jgi:hypothetical protein